MSDNTELNVVRDWDFNINVVGLQAPTGGAGPVPEGYYAVVVTDMYVNPEKNAERVVIKLTISDGPFKGVVRTTGLNKPKSADDKVRYYWRGLAESVGYTAAQLDSGEVTFGIGTFKDRAGYVFYAPADEAADRKYDEVNFLPPAAWQEQKQNFEANPEARRPSAPAKKAAAPLGSAPAAAPAIQPATGGSALGGTATKAGILGRLGV